MQGNRIKVRGVANRMPYPIARAIGAEKGSEPPIPYANGKRPATVVTDVNRMGETMLGGINHDVPDRGVRLFRARAVREVDEYQRVVDDNADHPDYADHGKESNWLPVQGEGEDDADEPERYKNRGLKNRGQFSQE